MLYQKKMKYFLITKYILNLKKLIIEMKEKSAVYIAIGDDVLDRRIAEFINATNDPHCLTKLFLREREGVYQFGSKRIYVKMENDKVFSKCFSPQFVLEEDS